MSILPIFIPHLGCPHQCVFCNQKKISGQAQATLDSARKQITNWLTWFKPGPEQEAAFYGGSFTGLEPELQERLLELTDDLLERKIIGRVRCSTRPDYIDRERLRILQRHSVTTVELGVQSLDDQVLRKAERGHTAYQVEEAMHLLKQFGFTTGMQLMVGMPEQSFESLQTTIETTVKLKPDLARIYPLLVIKGTPLEASYLAGQFQPLTLEEAIEQASYAYDKLVAAGINVIRIGLQADQELCQPGNIVAGPFHPSMGELVKSRSLRNAITPSLGKLHSSGVKEVFLELPEKQLSKLLGLNKCNLKFWQQKFPELILKIKLNNKLTSVQISAFNK